MMIPIYFIIFFTGITLNYTALFISLGASAILSSIHAGSHNIKQLINSTDYKTTHITDLSSVYQALYTDTYFLKNQKENWAKTIEALFINPETHQGNIDCPTLKHNITSIKKILNLLSEGQMDEQYWDDLHTGKISGPEYFHNRFPNKYLTKN